MAQAGSAQREPSMEEILASIRRIIEDNDSGRKPDAPVAPAVDPVDFEVERVAKAPVEVDAFRTELRAEPAVQAETKPISLADLQAQLAEETPAIDYFPELKATNDDDGDARAVSAKAEVTEVVSIIADEVEASAAPEEDQFLAPSPVRSETPAPRPAIISEHASRQVAAAFGELSEAFAARSKKTFDDMAEEMLRPMLQDWLDNNLPTLVERLVREEIERVARGAQ